MGGFFAKDTLAEFKVSLLDNEIDDMDDAIQRLVMNFGKLATYEKPKHTPLKRNRIIEGSGHLYKICNDICDEIEPDPSDLDDIMIMAEMCSYRVKTRKTALDTEEWIQLWDETVELLEKIFKNIQNWKHMHYYLTMCNVLKSIEFIYKRRSMY